jgi:putative protease
LGGTPFTLARLELTELPPGLHLPVSELKALRRQLVAELTAAVERGAKRTVSEAPVIESVRGSLLERVPVAPAEDAPRLLPLCRDDAQLEAVIAAGLREVELDWMEMVGLQRAVERARSAGLRVTIATVRVQKPGEEGYDTRLDRLRPDAVLVRHWGAMMHFLERPAGQPRPVLHGDFSLNVTNSLTAAYLLGLGLDTLTFSHDLDSAQLASLLEHAPASRFAVALHHHIATFHTEHCVYSHTLSNGRDYRTCGRPCEKHQIALRDRIGKEHPVVVDVGCRNTVFNAQAQSAASLVPKLLEAGVRRYRVEFVRESQEEATRVLAAYQELLAGRLSPAEAVRRAAVHEQFGVTKGTMQVLTHPATSR